MNRFFLTLTLFVVFTGCARMSHKDLESGLEISYTGPTRGAVELVRVADPRAFDLAYKAMDEGMSTSLAREADGDVRFSAGYGYSGYYPGGNVGGYAPANTSWVPGQGFVVGPTMSTLPPLATSVVVTGVPNQSTGGAIVPCPEDRLPATVAEQAACASRGVKALTQNRTK